MRSTHHNLARTLLLSLIASLCLSVAGGAGVYLHAQETSQQTASSVDNVPADTARAIELYKTSHYQEAIEVLRGAVKQRKQDAQAWLHLGIAYSRAGEYKDARKAFEKAIKLRPEMPEAHIGMAFVFFSAGKMREAEAAATRALALDPRNAESHYAVGLLRLRQESPLKALEEINTALALNPNFGPALSLKTHALMEAYAVEQAAILGTQTFSADQPLNIPSPEQRAKMVGWLREAAQALDTFVKLFPASTEAATLRTRAEALRQHAESVSNSDAPLIFKASETTTRANISSRPEPLYTERARNKGVKGTVRLRMLLSFDGQVRNIQVVQGLPEGLTEMSILAARAMKFKPATRNGYPVSQFVTIEYNFNIY